MWRLLWELLLVYGLLGVYIVSLVRALERCSPDSRTMPPDKVWLLLIPVYNLIWQFSVVSNLAESLGNEFKRTSAAHLKPGKPVGHAMCIVSLSGTVVLAVGILFRGPFGSVCMALGAGLWLAGVISWIVYWVQITEYSKALQASSPLVAVGLNIRNRWAQLLFSSAAAIVLVALVFGLVTARSGLTARITPHSIEEIGGGPVWAVFERGVIYGDSDSPLRDWYFNSSACLSFNEAFSREQLNGRAGSDEAREALEGWGECGRSIRWIDVTNPTPFMLAMVLCAMGAMLKAWRTKASPSPSTHQLP